MNIDGQLIDKEFIAQMNLNLISVTITVVNCILIYKLKQKCIMDILMQFCILIFTVKITLQMINRPVSLFPAKNDIKIDAQIDLNLTSVQ